MSNGFLVAMLLLQHSLDDLYKPEDPPLGVVTVMRKLMICDVQYRVLTERDPAIAKAILSHQDMGVVRMLFQSLSDLVVAHVTGTIEEAEIALFSAVPLGSRLDTVNGWLNLFDKMVREALTNPKSKAE